MVVEPLFSLFSFSRADWSWCDEMELILYCALFRPLSLRLAWCIVKTCYIIRWKGNCRSRSRRRRVRTAETKQTAGRAMPQGFFGSNGFFYFLSSLVVVAAMMIIIPERAKCCGLAGRGSSSTKE